LIFIKQYGIQRSGTNYTQWPLENNFKGRVFHFQLGSKHMEHPTHIDWKHRKTWKGHHIDPNTKQHVIKAVEDKTIRYLITAKDPYSWIISYKRWVKNHTLNSDGLARRWNAKHQNWYDLARQYDLAMIVRYEDLLTDFNKTMEKIKSSLQLTQKRDSFVNMTRRFLASPALTQKKFDKDYYLNRKYIKELTEQDIDNCREYISPELMKNLGYTIL